MKKVLFVVNHDVTIYNHRFEIVERLIKEGYEVHISAPYGKLLDDLIKMGAIFHDIEIERHGMNPIKELKIIHEYKKLFRSLKPDIIFGFTIKPNIYGAIAARKYNIPFIANITGLGTAVEYESLSQKIFIALYKFAFKKVQCVFFQNVDNEKFFADRNIATGAHELIPGSGVNLTKFGYKEYPEDGVIRFGFVSRIMKEKGIDYYLEAAEYIKDKYENVEFHVCGFCEPEYDGKLHELNEKGVVVYHGMLKDVASFMEKINVLVHPTYYPEGLSNVLLEACATGRPIITTDRSGCREVVEDGINGYMIPQKDPKALIVAIEKFLNLSQEQRREMGIRARAKVEREFDKNFVVEKYLSKVRDE